MDLLKMIAFFLIYISAIVFLIRGFVRICDNLGLYKFFNKFLDMIFKNK